MKTHTKLNCKIFEGRPHIFCNLCFLALTHIFTDGKLLIKNQHLYFLLSKKHHAAVALIINFFFVVEKKNIIMSELFFLGVHSMNVVCGDEIESL